MLPSTVAVREYTGEMVPIGEMVADPKPAKHDAKYRELFCNLFLQFTSESTDKDESLIVKKVKEKVDKQFRKDKNSWRMRGVRRAKQAENKRSSVRALLTEFGVNISSHLNASVHSVHSQTCRRENFVPHERRERARHGRSR